MRSNQDEAEHRTDAYPDEDADTRCQLMALQEAGDEVMMTARLTPSYVLRSVVKAFYRPDLLARKAGRMVQVLQRTREVDRQAARASDGRPRIRPLGLQPGEWVRVKTADEIRATLDDDGRYDRLGYMDNVMDRFCGRTLQVHSRVERFFDERNWAMKKLSDVVLLEGTFCRPHPDDDVSWAGCQRSCFLFWKEAWLERTEEPRTVTSNPLRPEP